MYGAAEAADLLQDREVAGEVYELLAPFAERPMMASLAVACFGSTHHALGVASLTVGEHARAVEHFQAAVRANQALGHWPAAALSRHRLSQALLARGGPDDPAAAAVALATAAEEAAALRMVLPKHEPPSVRRPAGSARDGAGCPGELSAARSALAAAARWPGHPGRRLPSA